MALTLTLNAVTSPVKTAISWMTLNRGTSFVRPRTVTVYACNESRETKTELKNLPGVPQRSNSNESIVILDEINRQLQERVQRIKKIMASKSKKRDHAEVLVMIDAIQRLGLSYYFHDEIHGALRRQYESFAAKEGDEDLHDTALRFRLLRQQGYNVSSDCFSKFKDKDGKFKKELEKDIKGLLSLFEASQMHIHEDNILDDAAEFTRHHLKIMKNNNDSEDSIVGNTLTNPFRKSLPRLMAMHFVQNFRTLMKLLHNYIDEGGWMKEMQYLAEIDISVAQINYQNEITQVSRWLKGLEVTKELKLVRIKPANWHKWSLACLPDPNMVHRRIELTKAISFIYIIDDIFDVYGTLEELTLFTEAVNRWKYDNIIGLPYYMRVCLKNLYEAVNQISYETYNKHGWNPKEFLQRVWREICNAFLVEAKWFTSGHTPSTDDYMKNGIVSIGVNILCAYLYLLLGEGGNNTGRELSTSYPDIVSPTATILRLGNDLGNTKDKNNYGYDGSFIACFMNEHQGSSTESARVHIKAMITDAWKCLNKACLSSTPFTEDFKDAVLNIARFTPVMYSYDDSHLLPSLEKHMKSLLNNEQNQ